MPEKIDYIVHEGMMARQERSIKRLWILCIVMFLALVGTNAGWLWYESQFEDQVITQEVTQDSGDGGSNSLNSTMIGGDFNGETDSQDNSENP